MKKTLNIYRTTIVCNTVYSLLQTT